MRAKAANFVERHKHARYEKGETQTFYNEFFDCFGVDRKQVAVYEQRVKNLPGDKRGFIDLFMPGKLIIEQKSAGLDLRKANNQALDYYEWLPEAERPRYILTCDFQRWHLLDLETGRELRFLLPELKRHITQFAFIAGAEVRQFKNQKPVNPKATKLLTAIHSQLEEEGYSGHKLQLLLVRILFMLFADDTHIWPKDQLMTDLQQRTREDGSDLGVFLTQLFEALNTPREERQASLPEHFRRYPYINGRLFEESIGTATFDKKMRDRLIDACAFDWGEVSPAVFGALFEGVIDKITRRKKGAHYTPEDAIFRLIGPLFLEDMHDEFEKLKDRNDASRARALMGFHDKLASLTFFDPACGAGNFLVVTYRELRELEREVLMEIYPPGTRLPLGSNEISKLTVENFYGIEIDEFPSQIAQVALWMTDHIANVNLGDVYGEEIPSIPLVHAPNIVHGDALEMDWNAVLPAAQASYVLGNPPFVGAKQQSPEQRAQVQRIAKLTGKKGTLDYVSAWFLKAGDYVQGGDAKFAFVSTNSICQGEQVAQLWPKLFHEKRLEIAFAHTTFVWPGRAAVHCVIVGMAQRGDEPVEKRLFSYPDQRAQPIETRHPKISAYLFAAKTSDPYLVVRSTKKDINGAPRLKIGSKPVDGGYLIFTPAERAAASADDTHLGTLLKPYIGAEEFLNGGTRFIISLQGRETDARNSPAVLERLKLVRRWRNGEIPSKEREDSDKRAAASTRPLAATPSAYHVTVVPTGPFMVIPENGSATREYVPVGWITDGSVPSSLIRISTDATLYHFGVLVSHMHMLWVNHIGGKLKSDPRYSIELVYNTFPWPDSTEGQRQSITALATKVVEARGMDKNTTLTLASLYNPDLMPPELRKAHRELDAAVDRLYAPRGFVDDRARIEHLFKLYEALVMPTAAAAAANKRTTRRIAREAAI